MKFFDEKGFDRKTRKHARDIIQDAAGTGFVVDAANGVVAVGPASGDSLAGRYSSYAHKREAAQDVNTHIGRKLAAERQRAARYLERYGKLRSVYDDREDRSYLVWSGMMPDGSVKRKVTVASTAGRRDMKRAALPGRDGSFAESPDSVGGAFSVDMFDRFYRFLFGEQSAISQTSGEREAEEYKHKLDEAARYVHDNPKDAGGK